MRFLVALLLFATPLVAAPPTLTALYPSGGQQGKTLNLTATGTFDPWPVESSASAKGITVKAAKEKGKFTVSIAADVPTGLYSMQLKNADGASQSWPFFVGTLTEVMEADPNDDPKKPHVLADSNIVVNGKLNPNNDVDHFAVELKKGQTLVASLQANAILKSPMDGILQVLSAEGFVLAENNDRHGLDPQIVFTVPKDGRYLVRVFAFPSKADSSIRFFGSEACLYRLTLCTMGYADHAFPLAISAKQPADVELIGWNIPDEAKRISLNAEAIGNDFAVRHPKIANPVLVRVELHSCSAEREPNDRAQPQTIETPITISGRISPARDIDAFSMTLKKGDKRSIKVEAEAIGSRLDAVLEVFDSAGKSLKEIDDVAKTPDAELLFNAPTDGTYRVEIRDRYQHGGEHFYYRLRVTPPAPK